MKLPNASLVLLAAASLSLLTGCVGTGPNTQRDAVGGAALGAIAGAIIGNNSGSHDAVGGAALGAIAGAIAGGTLGNAVDHEQGTIYTQSEPPPQPAPRMEDGYIIEHPSEAIWIPGCWVYGRHGYFWRSGRWEIPPAHYRVYVAPHWEHHPRGGYYWHDGCWR